MTGIRRKTAGASEPRVEHHPARHAVRQGRHHRARAGAQEVRAEVEKAGGKLTVTAVAAKIVASALKEFPQFNASVDRRAEIDRLQEVRPRRHRRGHRERPARAGRPRTPTRRTSSRSAVEIQQLAEKARARKLSLDDMSGGSMSISNLGGIGGTAFTPIVNWPEVAILGISRGAFEPVWKDGEFEPRQMLPLSLSYDHRLIDGADAIRFLRWVVEALENPFALILAGRRRGQHPPATCRSARKSASRSRAASIPAPRCTGCARRARSRTPTPPTSGSPTRPTTTRSRARRWPTAPRRRG